MELEVLPVHILVVVIHLLLLGKVVVAEVRAHPEVLDFTHVVLQFPEVLLVVQAGYMVVVAVQVVHSALPLMAAMAQMAQSVSFGPEIPVASHQLVQAIFN
jgi:hypothetical protein